MVCRDSSSTAQALVTSLPVPQVVGTAYTSKIRVGFSAPGLRSKRASVFPAEVWRESIFAVSITAPPPMAQQTVTAGISGQTNRHTPSPAKKTDRTTYTHFTRLRSCITQASFVFLETL